MRKLVKAAAALTAGCMLLSTSAFAMTSNLLLEGENTLTNGAIDVNIEKLGAGQSTIIVLKGNTALADASEDNILYINQTAISETGTASYNVNLGADFTGTATVYAGGTNETATTLGVLSAAPAAPSVVPVTGVAIDAEDSMFAKAGSTLTFNVEVLPEDATDKTVVWSTSDDAKATVENGVVTISTGVAGEVTITAACGDVQDSVVITIYTPGDLTGSEVGTIDINDVDAAQQMSLNLGSWTAAQRMAADVVGSEDGVVDINDVDAIQQKSLNLSVQFK